MDMPLLSNPVSEYNKRDTGAHFTVPCAGIPSYRLSRRAGIRRATLGDRNPTEYLTERDTPNPDTNREDSTPCGYQTQTANRSGFVTISGDTQKSDDKAPDRISQNDSESDVSHARGRTEWRRPVPSSRSKSLDWRERASSPAQDSRTGALTLISGNQAGLGSNKYGTLERGGRAVFTEDQVTARANYFKSEGTANGYGENSSVGSNPKPKLRRSGNAVDKSEWGQSLPIRLRPQSYSGSGIRDPARKFGPVGGQSIWERIEKLYGSKEPCQMGRSVRTKRMSLPVGDWPQYDGAGRATTDRGERESPNSSCSIINPATYLWRLSYEGKSGDTFPRRFSRGKTNNFEQNSKTPSPSPDCKSSLNPDDSILSVSPVTDYTARRIACTQWQCNPQENLLERSSVQWDRDTLQMGTRSLDRAKPCSL
ncbi:hypothetical protein NHX12_001266 [Muraenolepis orangiensis]|uniref:Uncharacterized protein n=1 Tax=Muraenolepis orangiensis TaxID=630683 RepID=A0A9Q0E0E3_9TELE|nr:hypothetical protein NHX12_001266 [Muraenolepis orangiensis]